MLGLIYIITVSYILHYLVLIDALEHVEKHSTKQLHGLSI